MHDHARAANSAGEGRGKIFRMGSHSEVVYQSYDWDKILYLICIKLGVNILSLM